jgi:dTDP-4-amino-4,6-dideoxygalactose transaminase
LTQPTKTGFKWRYLLSDVSFDHQEEEAVVAVIRSGWLSMGPRTAEFEEKLRAYLGTPHALATSNCTASLHLAMIAMGLGPGQEVIVPSLSFVATSNAALYVGATPVFADIESLERPLISVREVEARITQRTKAIVVMHYGGFPCDMKEILALAARRGVPVIEDAAHAIGSRYQGRACGTLGAIGCYSFFGNKNLPAGEGGAIVTSDQKLFDAMRLCRSQGMTALSWDRVKGHSFGYDVVELGYNFRMPELSAAVALVQLAKLDEHNSKRSAMAQAYLKQLPPELIIPFANEADPGARHLMPVLLPKGTDRDAFMTQLRERGIQSSIHYAPIHQFSHYRRMAQRTLPLTEEYAQRVVTLPLHPKLTEDSVAEICAQVRSALS